MRRFAFSGLAAGLVALALPAAAADCANFYGDKCRVKLSTGITLSYVDQGPRDGMPVIFLHGYTDSSLEFVTTAAALAARDKTLRLLALDQRGAGETDLPDTAICRSTPSRCITNAARVADVAAFLDALKLPKAVLVGHSMGSVVARGAALAAPSLVAKLVLIGTPAPLPAGQAGMAGLPGLDKTGGEGPLDPAFWQKSAAERGLAWPQGVYNLRLLDLDPDAVADLARYWDISTVAPAEFSRAIAAQTATVKLKFWDIDRTPIELPAEPLDHLAVPTLVLWGTQDSIMTKAAQDKLIGTLKAAAAAHPGMRFTWKQYGVRPLDASGQQTDDIGHEIVWEASAELAADLDSFIRTGAPTLDLYRTDAPADLHRIVTEPGKAITVSAGR